VRTSHGDIQRTSVLLAATLALFLACGPLDSAAQTSSGASSAPVALPPAGLIPPALSLNVTGSPADGAFLYAQICDALDRAIRPTLRPGSFVRYGPLAPWPLSPLSAGDRTAVNVAVTLNGGMDNAPVTGVTRIDLTNEAVAPTTPSLLFLSDDPEYLQGAGLAFREQVDAGRSARLYYYHGNIGLPRDLDIVLTSTVASRVQIIASTAPANLDAMGVGHAVSRDLLLAEQQNEGIVIDLAPGVPFTLRHDLILQQEVVAGAIDVHPFAGGAPVQVSVVASPAGTGSEPYLNGPRLAFDGHNRHGTFDLDGYGVISTTYTAGGPDVAVKYGHTSPPNLDPADSGRDYGAYGVVHRITFNFVNPTDTSHRVYLYERPLGGSVRSSFLVDGRLKEVGCARLAEPYWFMTYELPPHFVGASTTQTMPDGGSSYPVEFGTTETRPVPITPPLNAADGCSPKASVPAESATSQTPAAGNAAQGLGSLTKR
jgi:hypothetical protein